MKKIESMTIARRPQNNHEYPSPTYGYIGAYNGIYQVLIPSCLGVKACPVSDAIRRDPQENPTFFVTALVL